MDLAGLGWFSTDVRRPFAAVDSGIEWKAAVKKDASASLGKRASGKIVLRGSPFARRSFR
jgi:hypothetical protein